MPQTTQATKASKKQTQDATPKATAQHTTAAIPSFDELPDSALVRQSQLVRDHKHPTRPTPLPFSAATLWRKVRDQSFPAPVRLGAAITAWKVGDIRQWLAAQAAA